MNAYGIVSEFERRVADYAGAKHGIAVDCCTSAIFLSMKYITTKTIHSTGPVIVPARTYISVPMAIIHAGIKIKLEDFDWVGTYQLKPYPIIDGAKRFRKGMYEGGFHCLSFHIKKLIDIGRGGMILTDDAEAARWLRKARYDGREGKPYDQESVDMLGYHVYMTPEQAARGLSLLDVYADQPDQTEDYPDLRKMPVFKDMA